MIISGKKHSKKIIGINVLFVVPHEVGGTEYHVRSYIESLQQLDKNNQYILFCNQANFHTYTITSPNWRKVVCSVNGQQRFWRVLYEQLILPFLLIKNHCQVLHSFGYTGLLFAPCRQIISLHDTNWLDCPEDMPVLTRFVLHFLITFSLRPAKYIITSSQFARDRILNHYPQYRDKVKIIWSALGEDFYQKMQVTQKNPSPNYPYILCVSGLYPHKKVLYALALWQKMQKKFPANFQFVLIGKNGLDEKKIIGLLKTIPHVLYFPNVSFPKLIAWYQYARLFIFPSVYEGFGYPIYEAWAAGRPIACGDPFLFHPQIRSNLRVLEFNLNKDSQVCLSLVQETANHPRRHLSWTHNDSTNQLIALYNQI